MKQQIFSSQVRKPGRNGRLGSVRGLVNRLVARHKLLAKTIRIHSKLTNLLTLLRWSKPLKRTPRKIRPHRFGGEGVLIGVQFGYTKCSSHICLYSSRYISFSWGGPLKCSQRNPSSAGVFVIFRTIFGRWIWRGYWDGILSRFGGFRQPKNGLGRLPATEKRTTMKQNCKYRCFQRIWDVRVLNTLQKPVFWTNFILKNAQIMLFLKKRLKHVRTCVLDRLYAQKCINYVGVEGKQSKNTAKKNWSMFNIFTRTEPKTCGVGGPPREAGWIKHGHQCSDPLCQEAPISAFPPRDRGPGPEISGSTQSTHPDPWGKSNSWRLPWRFFFYRNSRICPSLEISIP